MEDLEKQVLVQLNRNTNTLTIVPASVQLGHREWVQWKFEGLQENEFGFISFAPPLPRLGPFYSLRSLQNTAVLGKGNKGNVGSSVYTALVLTLDSPDPVASASGTIVNTTSTKNTAPEIYVEYKPADSTHPLPRLEVSPDPVGLNTGDTATWHFVNLPSNAFACFDFESVVPGMKKESGPFIAFSACNGDDSVVEASGTGFAVASPGVKEFTYCIELRDWNGHLLARHDPQIDNLGPLPTPP